MRSYYDGCMIDNVVIDGLRRKFKRLRPELDERGRRCWAASEALELGHGGIKAVAQAAGLGKRITNTRLFTDIFEYMVISICEKD